MQILTQACTIITVVLCNNAMLKVLITLVNTGIVLTPHHCFHVSLGHNYGTINGKQVIGQLTEISVRDRSFSESQHVTSLGDP